MILKYKEERVSEYLYGDLYTIEEFKEYVDDRYIMNYDGHGYYSNGEVVYVDNYVDCERLRTSYSHVMWFNK